MLSDELFKNQTFEIRHKDDVCLISNVWFLNSSSDKILYNKPSNYDASICSLILMFVARKNISYKSFSYI